MRLQRVPSLGGTGKRVVNKYNNVPRRSFFNSRPQRQQIDKNYVNQLVSKRVPFFSNPQEFYTSEEVYKADIENVWKKNWLYAGYSFQIPKAGDFITYQVGNESLIIIRGKDTRIRAFYNVCRHRGSRLCTTETGHKSRIVCPYHGWTYSSEGNLIKANWMQESFDPSKYSLHPAHLQEVSGLIYICLSPNPPDFEEARKLIEPEIRPHRFDLAKIAHEENYDIKANWKLVYENNRECYHCTVAHPEYIKSNYDTSFVYAGHDAKAPRVIDPENPKKSEIEQRIQEENQRWASLGLHASPDSSFPGAGWYRASRTPLRKGWVTESLDGQPVSRLMGEFTDYDMGSCRVHTLPNFWIHASSDHAVATRLTPDGPSLTKAKVTWIVHKDAEEGKDYNLDRILPFWKLTSEQDWKLCEHNHQGILSEKYQPGPFSDKKEAGVEKFINWYTRNLQQW